MGLNKKAGRSNDRRISTARGDPPESLDYFSRTEKKMQISHSEAKRVFLKFIRGVFKYAVEMGVLTRNPTPEMKFRTGDKIKKVLTEPQVQILLNKAREYGWEWYPHVAVALYTGMRNGEIYALTWDKVDLDESEILVDCSWNSVDGLKSTKTGGMTE